ncbi:hypothetical protein GF336_03935 [Candidatus Woesearchaeota archaeon]|nr:hypothetical protein [Candidatus Woesearchaeota archaeon]
MKNCPICEKRKSFWQMLNKLDEHDREMQRSARLIRGYDATEEWIPGKKEALNECCCRGNIVGSIGYEYDWKRKKWKSHYHICGKCGKRWPEKGGYEGDYFDEELGPLPNGRLVKIEEQKEKLGGIKNENKKRVSNVGTDGISAGKQCAC